MIIKDNTLREHAVAWAVFLGIYALVYGITLYLGRFVDAAWDIRLLIFLNPDAYVPILDELVIFQTDFGAYYLSVFLIAWQIGYYLSRNSAIAQERTQKVFYGLAVVFGVWHGLGMFIQNKGVFWWSEYEYPIVFLPLGLVFVAGFIVIGNLYVRLDDDDQRKLAHAFWLTLVALFFVNFIGEDIIKATIQRHRPLHGTYEAWNEQLRILPDEVVRGSYSYISGHTSSFWAQTVVFFWLIKSMKFRVPLVALGLFHGYTRIYTAVHFPYCVIMATVFGFAVASLVYFCFWNHKHTPLIAMLGLTLALYALVKSPVAPAILLAVTMVWFLVNAYLTRDDETPPPMDNEIRFGET